MQAGKVDKSKIEIPIPGGIKFNKRFLVANKISVGGMDYKYEEYNTSDVNKIIPQDEKSILVLAEYNKDNIQIYFFPNVNEAANFTHECRNLPQYLPIRILQMSNTSAAQMKEALIKAAAQEEQKKAASDNLKPPASNQRRNSRGEVVLPAVDEYQRKTSNASPTPTLVKSGKGAGMGNEDLRTHLMAMHQQQGGDHPLDVRNSDATEAASAAHGNAGSTTSGRVTEAKSGSIVQEDGDPEARRKSLGLGSSVSGTSSSQATALSLLKAGSVANPEVPYVSLMEKSEPEQSSEQPFQQLAAEPSTSTPLPDMQALLGGRSSDAGTPRSESDAEGPGASLLVKTVASANLSEYAPNAEPKDSTNSGCSWCKCNVM